MASDNGQSAGTKESQHTAVIYFHGMGDQRHYEETSRLIDAMDRLLAKSSQNRGAAAGRLVGIQPRIEVCRTDVTDTVTYIRTRYQPSEKEPGHPPQTVRFYEVYWAPVMAGAGSPLRILKWVFRQVLRPYQNAASPWRERPRLRRAALVELFETRAQWPAGTRNEDFDRLISHYDDYENWSALRQYPGGSFVEFLKFVRTQNSHDAGASFRLSRLSKTWFRSYLLQEIRNGAVLHSLALAFVLAVFAICWATLVLLVVLAQSGILQGDGFLAEVRTALNPSWASSLAIVGTLSTMLGVSTFLTNYLGDVEAWATYEETDEKHQKRNKIIERGLTILEHVLADEKCGRAVVVGHSLGTTIAHDCLLAASRRNRATNAANPIDGRYKLERIRHFVTIASPIDKIEYFFESYRSKIHRYRRVVENLRGDIGDAPFSKNRKPHIHGSISGTRQMLSAARCIPRQTARGSAIMSTMSTSRIFIFPTRAIRTLPISKVPR